MHYYTKVVGRPISEAEAYWRATPAQRATWWPTGAPVKADTAGPAGVELVTGGSLGVAVAAGQRALREGFGAVLPDGRVPCEGECMACTYGHPEQCRRPRSKAEAILRRHQANTREARAVRLLEAAEAYVTRP